MLRKIENVAREWLIGIETRGVETKRYRPNAVYHATVDCAETRRVLRRLDLQAHDTFIEVGAVKGRVVCLAAQCRTQKVVGIECGPRLTEIARTNTVRTPIEIHNLAAEHFDYSAATILYRFNSFEANVRDTVLHKVNAGRAGKSLRLAFIMQSPAQRAIFEKSRGSSVMTAGSIAGLPVAFYRAG